jgi:hypothetical protein
MEHADKLAFEVGKRYRGADLKSIGLVLRAEWGLTADQADEAVKTFFEEVPV